MNFSPIRSSPEAEAWCSPLRSSAFFTARPRFDEGKIKKSTEYSMESGTEFRPMPSEEGPPFMLVPPSSFVLLLRGSPEQRLTAKKLVDAMFTLRVLPPGWSAVELPAEVAEEVAGERDAMGRRMVPIAICDGRGGGGEFTAERSGFTCPSGAYEEGPLALQKSEDFLRNLMESIDHPPLGTGEK